MLINAYGIMFYFYVDVVTVEYIYVYNECEFRFYYYMGDIKNKMLAPGYR